MSGITTYTVEPTSQGAIWYILNHVYLIAAVVLLAGLLMAPLWADEGGVINDDQDEWGTGSHVYDGATGTVRICDDLCTTCIFHPGNRMSLQPGRVKDMLTTAVANEGHIVCHKTLDTPEPAICAGFAAHPQGAQRSLALRLVAAGVLKLKRIMPSTD